METQSYLLSKLQEHSEDSNLGINYWDLFKNFRNDVAPELSQTDWLFPEFTPHDEDCHIRSLLRLTDELLGKHLISELNACEQFILACSLYGHDWGMAVSSSERDDILLLADGKLDGESKFSLLPNEGELIREFLADRSLTVSELPHEAFRDYARLTHPTRAKCRINTWFSEGRRRLGEAVGTISEGHWYEIDQVRKLSRTESIDGHTVNLAALTAYIRLIDLLDIAENRTPYKLWKFINPRDPFSAMEWKKHEALSPIQVERSPSGNRVVLVHGSTNDYRVEANLQDLRDWCETQFNENRGLFVEFGDPYDPGLSWIDWKIEPIGFTPAHVRFDFDRDRTFDLISSEIYDNDPFVFIRELIQNAIDATVLRRELTSKTDAGLTFEGGVVDIEIVTDGDKATAIRVMDKGVGMDLDTVEHYLAVAGRSYYRSSDFEKLNLSMSPISRFGIGLLSCFMVANELKITTRKDRLVSDAGGLNIEIPHIRNQFHIRESAQTWTGTEVSVILCEEKLRNLSNEVLTVENISSFIRTVAGLSPIPICISHNGVVVEELPAVIFDKKHGFISDNGQPLFTLDKLAVFGLTNVGEANAIFGDEKRFAIHETIGSFEIDVTISYFERRPEVFPLPSQGQPKLLFLDSASNTVRQTKWKNRNETKSTTTGSWETNLFERVFLNGILVPNAELKIGWGGHQLPEPRVTANIRPSDDAARTSVSRRTISCSPTSIGDAITGAFDSHLCGELEKQFEDSSPKDRLMLLSQILRSRHISPVRLAKQWPIEQWPLPIFGSSGIQCELVTNVKTNYDAVELLPFQYLIDNIAYFANGANQQAWLLGTPPMIAEISAGLPERVIISSDLIFSNYGQVIQGDVGYGGLSHLFGADSGFHPSSFARVVSVAGKNWMFRRFTSQPTPTLFPKHLSNLVEAFVDNSHVHLQFKKLDGVPESTLGVIELNHIMFHDNLERARRLTLNLRNPLCKSFIAATENHARRFNDLSELEAESMKELLEHCPVHAQLPAYQPGITEAQLVAWLMKYCLSAVTKGWLDSSKLADASQHNRLIPVHSGWH